MFQYTKDTILHGVAAKVKAVAAANPYTGAANAKKLTIQRVGEYFSDCVVGKKVYVTEGHKGAPGVMTINTDKITEAGEYLLTFRVITPNSFIAEYASPNWQVFGKPMIVGFEVTDTAKVAEVIEKAINLAIPEGNTFVKVEKSAKTVTVTGTTDFMTFDKVYLGKKVALACPADSCDVEYEEIADVATVTKNVEPFATADWLVENLRFPTYPNIRYASANEDERPIPGEIYTEYSFAYESPRPGFGGQSGVGQGMTAVTRHIFYVPSAEVAAFEAELTTFGLTAVGKDWVGVGKTGDTDKDGYADAETTFPTQGEAAGE